MLVIAIQLFIIYYSYHFWKALPADGSPQYNAVLIHSTDIPMTSLPGSSMSSIKKSKEPSSQAPVN